MERRGAVLVLAFHARGVAARDALGQAVLGRALTKSAEASAARGTVAFGVRDAFGHARVGTHALLSTATRG